MENYLDLTTNQNYNKLQEAGKVILNGGLVLFPTETVYGIGANGLNEIAVKKIYIAKGRSSDNPLILHISDYDMLKTISQNISDIEYKLINKFWPGPFTIILERTSIVPNVVTGGLNTVGVRMPSNKIAHELIKYANVPIAAPSANISGKPSGTNLDDISEELFNKVDYIVNGGSCDIGLESTVVRVINGIPHILRPGKITAEQIKSVAGDVVIDEHVLGKLEINQKILSPGMKYRHYAPKAELLIVEGKMDQVIETINRMAKEQISKGYKVGIIGTEESVASYKEGDVKSIGTREDESTIAVHLYGILREFDQDEVDYIYSESFATGGIGSAIMNRLLKAAGHHVINI